MFDFTFTVDAKHTKKICASEQTLCTRVDFSVCPKIRTKQYFHGEFLVEVQGEQRQCLWSPHSPAQCRPLGCSGGSSARWCPPQQSILTQNKHRTDVPYKIAAMMKLSKLKNSREKPADSGVSTANLNMCSLAVLLVALF